MAKSIHKRCPFDNGTPRLMGGQLLNNGGPIYWIKCLKCKVSQLYHPTKESAWAAWDKRV